MLANRRNRAFEYLGRELKQEGLAVLCRKHAVPQARRKLQKAGNFKKLSDFLLLLLLRSFGGNTYRLLFKVEDAHATGLLER